MSQVSVLEALLGAKPVTEITDEVFIERLGVSFKVKALTGDDINKLKEECTRYKIKGKERVAFLDEGELGLSMVVKATIEPDFSAKELLAHYGAKTANECLNKALIAGELAKLNQAVVTVSGLTPQEEKVEEVKN